MQFDSVDQILDYAIEQEEKAAAFYTGMASKVNRPFMKDVFLGFANEEKGHKAKLEAVKGGRSMISAETKVMDLKIGDNLVEVDLDPSADIQDALIVAMKAEKAAFKLYTDLAGACDDANLKEVFLGLAQEEAKHKLRFEVEYDEVILNQN